MKIDNTKNRVEQVQYDESDLDSSAELDMDRIKTTSWIVASADSDDVKFLSIDDSVTPHIPSTLVLSGEVGAMFSGDSGVRVSSVLTGNQLSALIGALAASMTVAVDMDKSRTSLPAQFYTASITAKPQGEATNEQETNA